MPDTTRASPPASQRRIARARLQVEQALGLARRGRPGEAERRLRDALGVLERRQHYAGAARAAATLGCVLRERGDTSRAASTFDRAHVLFDVAQTVNEATPPGGIGPEQLAEHEDYLRAQSLLAVNPVRPTQATESGQDWRQVVAGCEQLLKSYVQNDSLIGLCAQVKHLTEADAVGAWTATERPVCFATSGTVPKAVLRRLGRAADSGDIEAPALSELSAVVEPIPVSGPVPALITAYFKRRPAALTPRTDDGAAQAVRALLRIAGVLAAPAVQTELNQRAAPRTEPLGGMVGQSRPISDLRDMVARYAGCPYPVMIEGETGTGKELVARALHRHSPRRGGPFCAVNCAALTDDLFEAELFGHARGAFTGAVTPRLGLFEEAHRGTLFLDEVGELSPRAQAKVLRAVQEREVRRLGENASRRIDIRLVAATNRVLETEVAAGLFREDLMFRLSVVRLRVPPLRVRGGDIVSLANHFWSRAQSVTGGQAALSADTLAALVRYEWPGNVRELENVMASLAVRAPKRGWVRSDLLPAGLRPSESSDMPTLADARRRFDREFVRTALTRAGHRPGVAARELGISRQGLAKLMARLDLDRDR